MSFGSDFSAVDDIDEFLTFLSGEQNERVAYMQSIARRYTTPRFGLFYDQTYGLDLSMFVGDPIPKETVQSMTESEARKDERTKDCMATIAISGESWRVRIVVTPQDGETFTLTLSVDRVSVSLLSME